MKLFRFTLSRAFLGGLVFGLASTVSAADGGGSMREVVLKNISHNLTFTPPIVAICRRGVPVVATLGEPASEALEELAEGGATDSLAEYFRQHRCSVVQHDAPVGPGETMTVKLRGRYNHKVYALSMALPTNDAFVVGPGDSVRRLAKRGFVGLQAYDAGTEFNDELCANIPGPRCGGTGFDATRDDVVNYVHPHGGITGVGDLLASRYEWGEPVALIKVNR